MIFQRKEGIYKGGNGNWEVESLRHIYRAMPREIMKPVNWVKVRAPPTPCRPSYALPGTPKTRTTRRDEDHVWGWDELSHAQRHSGAVCLGKLRFAVPRTL